MLQETQLDLKLLTVSAPLARSPVLKVLRAGVLRRAGKILVIMSDRDADR